MLDAKTTVSTASSSVDPTPVSSLAAGQATPPFDRDRTLTPTDCYNSDSCDNPNVISLLSDEGDEADQDVEDRKSSPAPTGPSQSSSVRFLGTVDKDDEILEPFPERKPGSGRPHRSTPRVRMTDEEQTRAVALREAGWTQARIAEHLGRPSQTIRSFLRRRNNKMAEFLSSLPGSQPRPAAQRRGAQHQRRRAGRGVGSEAVAGGSRPGRGERVQLFSFNNDSKCGVKPGNKKEEPM